MWQLRSAWSQYWRHEHASFVLPFSFFFAVATRGDSGLPTSRFWPTGGTKIAGNGGELDHRGRLQPLQWGGWA